MSNQTRRNNNNTRPNTTPVYRHNGYGYPSYRQPQSRNRTGWLYICLGVAAVVIAVLVTVLVMRDDGSTPPVPTPSDPTPTLSDVETVTTPPPVENKKNDGNVKLDYSWNSIHTSNGVKFRYPSFFTEKSDYYGAVELSAPGIGSIKSDVEEAYADINQHFELEKNSVYGSGGNIKYETCNPDKQFFVISGWNSDNDVYYIRVNYFGDAATRVQLTMKEKYRPTFEEFIPKMFGNITYSP